MQGESREDLSPCDPMRGFSSLERSCKDSALGSWYTDVFPGFIKQCRDSILEEAGGDKVTGLILTGSFASSEGSVVMLGGRPLFLSDIDILLIVSSPAYHAEIYPRRSHIGEVCEKLIPGALFEGRIDVGVMTHGELAAMPFSPGVFEMRECGMMLHGSKELMDMFPAFGPGEIGRGEALRLLENRMAAFLGDRPASDSPEGVLLLKFLYGISRVYTDILTASLSAAGLYRSGYAARARFLDSSEGMMLRGKLGDRLADAAVSWTGFKIDPDAADVWTGDDSAAQAWLDAAGDLLAVRDRILGKKAVERSGPAARPLDLLRAWKRCSADMPLPARLRLSSEALLAGWVPGEQIRKESVRLIRHAVEKGTEGETGAAPCDYPHGGGSWKKAAAITSSRWRRLVTGREDTSLE